MKAHFQLIIVLSHIMIAAIFSLYGPAGAEAMEVGQTVTNVTVRDARDKPAQIPHLGQKTVLIYYVDPDVSNQNDPFTRALKKYKFPDEKFYGLGIVNLLDTKYPNAIVRAMVRREMKASNAVILTDPDSILQKSWDLGNCNNKSVIILIDKNRKVRFFKKGALSDSEISSAIDLIGEMVKQ